MAQGNSKIYFLYRHVRHDTNNVFYIGIGTKENKYIGYPTEHKRAYDKNRRSKYWKNIVNKTTYDVEILFETSDIELIKSKEKEFILLYGRNDLKKGTLVNHNDGGTGLEGTKHSIETRLKISNSNKGRTSAMKNKKHSEETKKRIGNSNRGKKLSLTTIEKIKKRTQGVNNNRSKFTDEDIITIRTKYNSGNYKQVELANIFNTDQGTISAIIRNKKWKHIN